MFPTGNLPLNSTNGVKLLVMTPIYFIQELSSKIRPNVKFQYQNSNFEAKCVEIYFNRTLKPYVLNDWKFPRPSNDTTLNEFYLENDNKFVADKIKATFYYRKKLIVEIRIKHSVALGQRYYKWRLEGAEIIE